MAVTNGDIGVFHCGELATRKGWYFRDQPKSDIGIDAHMELVEDSGRTKNLVALQIKTGPSWFENKKNDCYIFRDINERQYNYWTHNSLPCILVMYNPDDDTCIWQELNKKTIEKTRNGEGKGYFVRVPISQVFLDDISNSRLKEYSNLPEYIINYNFLLSQKLFMQIIKSGGSVKLHSKEWVNKCSGKGNIELIVDDGNGPHTYSYPYWFPYTMYTDVFPRLFPWANFTADADFYYEEDQEQWKKLHCYYDPEENKYIRVGDSFSEFRSKLDPMRCIDYSGELAEYMLILSLNDLGEAFLLLDEYASKERPYSDAKPKEV